MKKRIALLLLIVFFSIAGFAISRFSASSTECIASNVVTVPSDMFTPHPKQEFASSREDIPSWWSIQPNWWQPFQGNLDPGDFITALAAKNDIVWVSFAFHILRYNSKTGSSNSYDLVSDSQEPIRFSDIFFTRDGTLWTIGSTNRKSNSVVVARYNSLNDKFEIVPKLVTKNDKEGGFFVDSEVLGETIDGKLILPLGTNIVVYDQNNDIVHPLLPQDFSQNVSALTVSNNKVWFIVGQDMNLRSVDLKTNELVDYEHIPGTWEELQRYKGMEAHNTLAVDSDGSVWIGYFAKLKLGQDGKYGWEKIIYPPEFVTERVVNPYADNPEYAYDWSDVYKLYAASDGSLWFYSSVGLVQYSPIKNTWCKSADMEALSVITDDGSGNLWMAIMKDNHLNIYMKK